MQIIAFVFLAILSFILITIYSYKLAIFVGVMFFVAFIKAIFDPFGKDSITIEKILISINEMTYNEKLFAYILAILGNLILVTLFFTKTDYITWFILPVCLLVGVMPFMNAYGRYNRIQEFKEYQKELLNQDYCCCEYDLEDDLENHKSKNNNSSSDNNYDNTNLYSIDKSTLAIADVDNILDKPAPDIVFKGNRFCFTGFFDTQLKLRTIVESRGGVFVEYVTDDANYLVIGKYVAHGLSFKNYGYQVEQALAYNKRKKYKIKIISEKHLLKFI